MCSLPLVVSPPWAVLGTEVVPPRPVCVAGSNASFSLPVTLARPCMAIFKAVVLPRSLLDRLTLLGLPSPVAWRAQAVGVDATWAAAAPEVKLAGLGRGALTCTGDTKPLPCSDWTRSGAQAREPPGPAATGV